MSTILEDHGTEELTPEQKYSIWKKNTVCLYDLVLTHSLEWPSLTVQWFNEIREEPEYNSYRLLMGTQTSQTEQNYVTVFELKLPTNTDKLEYDSFTGDFGAYGTFSGNIGRLVPIIKMKHEDDVNRARIMPQNQNLIATKSPTRKVYIYDITKHPSVPAENDTKVSSADLTLIGHNQEGFALDWNSNSPGKILSGGDDSLICSWDISKYDNRSDMLGKDVVASPSSVYTFHTSVISDVKWSLMHDSLFGSVSDDKILAIWDTRVGMQPQMIKRDAHDKEVNCLAFHPSNENFLLTGSSDQTIKLWDLRSPNNTISTFEQNEPSENKNPLSKMSKQNDPVPKTMMDKQQRHIFQHHENSVYSVEWSPNLETVFASASTDSTVHLWQLDQIGAEQSAEDAQDGPPELMFIHGGHIAAVSDICWHIGEQLLLTSVAEDNIVHIWKMNSDILSQVGDE